MEDLSLELRKMSDNLGWQIPQEVIDKFVSFSQLKHYAKGDVVAWKGNDASHSGIVIKGLVRSYYVDNDGNDITQFFAKEGNFCSDSGLLGFKENVSMWEAIEETTIVRFEVKKMKDMIMSNEALKTVWIECLESAIRYKIYRESGFLVENATERYLEFCKRNPDLADRIPQQYIATYLGIKPESLSRIRSTLKSKK